MQHPAYYTWIVFAGVMAVSWWAFAGDPSPDLMATWLAGYFFEQGAVYPGSEGVFTMQPPDAWIAELDAAGHEGVVYPYVYPPLWAALASRVVGVLPFPLVEIVATLVNPLLLCGMVWLAARTARDSDVSVPLMTLAGSLLLLATLPGAAALEQNQPQIIVSFLVVAAIERSRAGAPVTAGLALAVAAAIKVSPALLVVAWLGAGRYRESLVFAIAGLCLALASVLLAGWPMHAAFLAELDAIRNTVLATFFTYGVDPVVAGLVPAGESQFILGRGGETAWHVVEKPAVWSMLSTLAMVTILAVAAVRFHAASRDGREPDVLGYPVFLVAVTLVSPLAWGYHYLAPMAFLPHLLAVFGLRTGLLALLAVLIPLTPQSFDLVRSLPVVSQMPAALGTATMILVGLLLHLAGRRRAGRPSGHLQRPPVSL
ncbi:glycosyltransferase family 87 protein [Histidinibacterium aquaticum]|uniref:DUF2029 domain-containing protein n=1 Tax=Histidinibacterium aquaticum TaxID=2613962 RepID=A0A5J5GKZ2_9RHOB|nr:glycosyltransferase family 87 protein [Histidinibacterium aquaticum]KAA9008214.1 DUF2029 domain-containing protein [Histidinibacterium aquaticum]